MIELRVDDNQLVERIVGRFICAKCGEGYHDRFKRPKVRGLCDVCQSTEFTRRPDDNAETVNKRLMVYYRETSPLIGYYFCKGNLGTVDGMAPIAEVAGRSTTSWPRSNEEQHGAWAAASVRLTGRGLSAKTTQLSRLENERSAWREMRRGRIRVRFNGLDRHRGGGRCWRKSTAPFQGDRCGPYRRR